jgi:hypothetical protein
LNWLFAFIHFWLFTFCIFSLKIWSKNLKIAVDACPFLSFLRMGLLWLDFSKLYLAWIPLLLQFLLLVGYECWLFACSDSDVHRVFLILKFCCLMLIKRIQIQWGRSFLLGGWRALWLLSFSVWIESITNYGLRLGALLFLSWVGHKIVPRVCLKIGCVFGLRKLYSILPNFHFTYFKQITL